MSTKTHRDQAFELERAHAIDDDPMDMHADIDLFTLESLEEAVRPWRVAESLKALRNQVDAAAPGRRKASDGTIGDAAHATRSSDHNPWVVEAGKGVVTAMDLTHDPANGCDAGLLAETLRKNRDPRIKYIISNRRIASSAPKGSVAAWAWRAYTGSNPHIKHCHISVQPTKAHYDSTTHWNIASAFDAHESASVDQTSDEAFAEIERAAAALGASTSEAHDVPLIVRLIAFSEGAAGLLSRYSDAIRDGASQDGDALEAPAPAFAKIAPDYEKMFSSCGIPTSSSGVVAWHRSMLLKGRSRYEEAQKKTGVPWWFVGIVHAMEASFNFASHLHNGDPLARRTVQVPSGRPTKWNPPSDWLSSAIDALKYQGFKGETDWSLSRTLYRWETYNGWGYRKLGINSPYLWSFSNHYSKGKYVKDGEYDPNAISKQCGTAVMLKALQNAGDIAL